MVFGFGGDDSDEDKKKRRQDKSDEDHDEEGRKTRPGRHGKDGKEKPRPGKHAGKGGDDEDAKARPGRHGRKDDDDKDEDAKIHPGRHSRKENHEDEDDGEKPARPARHGKHGSDEDPNIRPGRHGRKGDDQEDAKLTRPGGQGRKGDDEDEAKAGRHGRYGREDDEDQAGNTARPTRYERTDDRDDGVKPTHAGKHGRAEGATAHGRHDKPGQNSAAEEPTVCGGGPAGRRPGRHAEHETGDDKPAADATPGEGGHQQQQQHAPAHGGIPPAQTDVNQHQPEPANHGRPAVERRCHVNPGQLQDALERAEPGAIIVLAAGVYNEAIKTKVDGTDGQPINIRGPKDAIVKGDDSADSCFEINHNHYVLDGFTICGEINGNCSEDNVRRSYRVRCLMIKGNRAHTRKTNEKGQDYDSAVDKVVIRNMTIRNSGEEAIRIRYFTTRTLIQHNKIRDTGRFMYKFGGDEGNGEGVYIGTGNKSWAKNQSGEADVCRYNRVRENLIDTQANECISVKEGSRETIIESNYCTGQKDDDCAGIDTRANVSIIRFNKVEGCKGAGIRLGGNKVQGAQYGVNCQVYGNELMNNDFGGIKVMTEPHKIFMNTINGNDRKKIRGECGDKFDNPSENPLGDKLPSGPDVAIEASEWFKELRT